MGSSGRDTRVTSPSTSTRDQTPLPGESTLVEQLTRPRLRPEREPGLGPTTYDMEAALGVGNAAVQRRPATAGPGSYGASTGKLTYLLAGPSPPGPGDPIVAYLETLDMSKLLDELSDAVACGYMLKLEARVSASPRLAAALHAVYLAQLARVTPSHPALQRAGTALNQVPDNQQLQILAWMLRRRGVSAEATALVEGVLAMREQGVAQPEPTPPGAGEGSRAPSHDAAAAGVGPVPGVTMPPPVEPGPWAPPGKQPESLYIGNSVHNTIARNYQASHTTDDVRANFVPVSSIVRDLGHNPNDAGLSDTERAMRPDIVNLTRLHLYEIKPVAAQALGAAKAVLAVGVFGRAGIAMQLGPVGEPGTEGGLPAPGGVCLFWSPQPGVIVYQYRRGRLVPVPVAEPEPAGERRWRFELQPLTREQKQAIVTTTVGVGLLILLMVALSPVGA
jgi:hypothetical protein